MAHFDEKAGVVMSKTPWGHWYQTIDEVAVLVDVPKGTRGKQVAVDIKPGAISVAVAGNRLFHGELFAPIVADDSVWTIEDGVLLRIVLQKQLRRAGNTWTSLLKTEYQADGAVLDEMEKKMTLERFQREHPGFDFSGADISGNYQGGGPQLEQDRS